MYNQYGNHSFKNFSIEIQIDESIVMEVMGMGFPLQACRKAVYHTKNAGIEAAMNWVMEHIDDAGLSHLM